ALCVAPAARAAGWVDGGPLSPADRVAADPQVVVAPGGESVIAWLQRLTDQNRTPENVSVLVASPGGGFGPTQWSPGQFDEPSLAVGADGTVALAWLDRAHGTVHVARHAPGQTGFTEATPAVVPGGETLNSPQVVVSGGEAFVTFASTAQNSSSI